eukprot:XP_011601555.1 PREDICTED: swi5-dependent recombination DNA repair protein 1 homolog [Takifugu rubripes]
METTPKTTKFRSVCSPCDSSPAEYTQKHPQNLSSSLKERLKRSRRSFTSPCSVAKRLHVDEEEEEDGRQVAAHYRDAVNNPSSVIDINRNVTKSGSEMICGAFPKAAHPPVKAVAHEPGQLRKEVKDKTETLRRLKMVKMYRSKNDTTQLQSLIDKWRSCAQAALQELQSDVSIHGGKASLSELIDLFGLDEGILHFDRSEEDFTS